ncbi:MAG: WbqC family protein [Planctomycetes bacterium]|nr:WbqC family protein [Planctomycetota bacterium]
MSPEKVVAIHQPNFFPWLGYFDKLRRADVFILLDHVQFPKKGGNWTNRVRLLVCGKPFWVTLPIVRAYSGVRRISEMRINDSTPWREKFLRTLQVNYARATHFRAVFPWVARLVQWPTDSLSDYNIQAIRSVSDALELGSPKIALSSSLGVQGQATDLLIALVKAAGGDAYLCGGGASGYQEDEKFPVAGMQLIQQGFVHPVYPQPGAAEFVPGLSILDALMHCGFEGTRALLVRP